MLNIYLMRHGQTDMNVKHMLQGRTNTHLNREGCMQAKKAGKILKKKGIIPDIIFSSPLKRACVTASYAAGIPVDAVRMDDRLIEMGFGESEGCPFDELDENHRKILFTDPERYVPGKGAESFESVMARTYDFIKEVTGRYRNDPENNNILVVSHGAAINGMITRILDQDISVYWQHPMGNCAVNIFRYDDNEERLIYGGFIEAGEDLFFRE